MIEPKMYGRCKFCGREIDRWSPGVQLNGKNVAEWIAPQYCSVVCKVWDRGPRSRQTNANGPRFNDNVEEAS